MCELGQTRCSACLDFCCSSFCYSSLHALWFPSSDATFNYHRRL